MAGLASIASTSTLAAAIAEPVLQRVVVSEVPTPPSIPSFQDIDSETQSDDETEEDWEAIVALGENTALPLCLVVADRVLCLPQ